MGLISQRIEAMEESATIAMAQKARDLKSKGVDVISLSLGEPDFKTPKHIQEAAKEAIDSGKYFAYPPVPGYQDLREAIAKKFTEENGIPTKPANVVVSTGAKQSLANIFMSILDPEDEVIVLSPYWVSYSDVIKVAEGVPVLVKGGIEDDFKATAEQIVKAITPKTKALIYSSPCNPTGSVFTHGELKEIANVLLPYENILVIADEIYEHINFTGEHASMGSFPEMEGRVITVNGVAKGFAMTGWRIGYISAPEPIAKACAKIQGQFTSGANSIAQRATLAALTSSLEPTQKMAEEYLKRRQLVHDLLIEIPGFKVNMPKGAFYFFPEVTDYFGKAYGEYTIDTAGDLCMYLLNEAHVSLVTGEAFGSPECVRLSYAASEEDLKEAISRIKSALEKLS
ncbi:MAG: pyridoxal phosphate-dependent aminotransferase [Cyclobacteriaceae bacterium]|nr:pyridoxal phosphate-dependent aminotransferase [Cyclobacteriaceae bacterium]